MAKQQRTPVPAISQVQPNAGWGVICVHCLHVFRDSAKYGADFKPDYPCVMVIHSGPMAQMPDLVLYMDGTESCNTYKESSGAVALAAYRALGGE